VGGVSKNRGSNLYLDPASKVIIAEADEYDRSFLTLFPEIAVVSSMDADHLDIYHSKENFVKGFELFIAQIQEKGKLILKYGLTPQVPDHVERFTYSLDRTEADYHVVDLKPEGVGHLFTVVTPGLVIPELRIGIPGKLNVENAVRGSPWHTSWASPRRSLQRPSPPIREWSAASICR